MLRPPTARLRTVPRHGVHASGSASCANQMGGSAPPASSWRNSALLCQCQIDTDDHSPPTPGLRHLVHRMIGSREDHPRSQEEGKWGRDRE
jgi:hypothetical protein